MTDTGRAGLQAGKRLAHRGGHGGDRRERAREAAGERLREKPAVRDAGCENAARIDGEARRKVLHERRDEAHVVGVAHSASVVPAVLEAFGIDEEEAVPVGGRVEAGEPLHPARPAAPAVKDEDERCGRLPFVEPRRHVQEVVARRAADDEGAVDVVRS